MAMILPLHLCGMTVRPGGVPVTLYLASYSCWCCASHCVISQLAQELFISGSNFYGNLNYVEVYLKLGIWAFESLDAFSGYWWQLRYSTEFARDSSEVGFVIGFYNLVLFIYCVAISYVGRVWLKSRVWFLNCCILFYILECNYYCDR